MVQKHKRPWYRPTPRLLLNFLIVTAVMLGVSKLTERLTDKKTFINLATEQNLAFNAVAAINPLDISRRYFCALGLSVEEINRQSQGLTYKGQAVGGHLPVAGDCRYTLSRVKPAPGAELPPPVVGHWGDGLNGIVRPFVALLDLAWHLIVQPSVFASIFAIFTFAAGGVAAGLLMALPSFTWHPYVGPAVFAVGTIALACVVGFCLKEIMEAGLYLFSGITRLGGFCCGASSVVVLAYQYVVKLIENGIHLGVEHVIPH
ncbi:MAG: hypothetical protein V4527_10800 [Pseudomonadota bacterium]